MSTVSFEEGLHDLCQVHGLTAVYLFGPPTGGKPGAAADARVGLVCRDPMSPAEMAGLQPKLLAAFRDLLGMEGLQLVFLQQAGPLLQYEGILGRLLYSADVTRRADFEERVVRDYLDFAFEIRLFDEELAEEIERETGKN